MSLIPAGTIVRIETKWFPPLDVDLSEATASGEPGRIVKLLQPKVTVLIKGQVLASSAPAGEPPVPNEWPKMKIALAVVAALTVFSILRIIR